MPFAERWTQKLNSFRNMLDLFKKIVIVNGIKKSWRNEEGFMIMDMRYFPFNVDSFEFQSEKRKYLWISGSIIDFEFAVNYLYV